MFMLHMRRYPPPPASPSRPSPSPSRRRRYPTVSPLLQPVPGTFHPLSPIPALRAPSDRGALDTTGTGAGGMAHLLAPHGPAATPAPAPSHGLHNGLPSDVPRARRDSDADSDRRGEGGSLGGGVGGGGGGGGSASGGAHRPGGAPGAAAASSDDDGVAWHDVGPPSGRPQDLEPFLPWLGGST